MNENMEKAIGEWFATRVVEWHENSNGVTLASIELHNYLYINLMIDTDNQIVGFCETIKSEED